MAIKWEVVKEEHYTEVNGKKVTFPTKMPFEPQLPLDIQVLFKADVPGGTLYKIVCEGVGGASITFVPGHTPGT